MKHLDIKPSHSNESVTWYQNGEEYLLICGVGGKDNFGKFFETKIKHPLSKMSIPLFSKCAHVQIVT